MLNQRLAKLTEALRSAKLANNTLEMSRLETEIRDAEWQRKVWIEELKKFK